MAKDAGIDNTYLGRIERGEYPAPKVQTAYKIAEALSLSAIDERRLLAATGALPSRVVGHDGPGALPSELASTSTSPGVRVPRAIPLDQLDQELRDAIKARQRGDVSYARYILQTEVVPGLRRVGDKVVYAEALTALGDVFRVERLYDDAETVFVTAKGVLAEELATRPTNEARFFDAQLDWALTKISLAQGDVAEARVRIDRAWRTLNEVRQSRGPMIAGSTKAWSGRHAMRPGFAEGVCAQITARVYWAEGKAEESLDWFDRSLEYLQDAQAPHTVAESQMYRLMLLNENPELFQLSSERLVDIAHETLAVGHSGPFPHVVAMVQVILSNLYKLLGLKDEAQAHLDNARRLKDVPELVVAHPDIFDRFQVALEAAA